jgi:hypothetical protein
LSPVASPLSSPAGRSTPDIAAELALLHRTVQAHVARVLEKLDVPSCSDIANEPQRTYVMQAVLKLRYYAAMASLLQVRNVPEEARRILKARAAARGESLNTYLLEMIKREISRPTVAEVLERAAQRAERASASAIEALDVARAERDAELHRVDRE